MRYVLWMCLVSLFNLSTYAQRVYYVNASGTGANNGSSWGDAYVHLQDALAIASEDDEVWVARGVYYPDLGVGITQGDREAVFELASGVSLYGGFRGHELLRDERDWEEHVTILSGDLGQNDVGDFDINEISRQDNAHQVIHVQTESGSATAVSGFIIKGAVKYGGMRVVGDGLAQIQESVFQENYSERPGGGMSLEFVDATLQDVSFVGNMSKYSAGGVYVFGKRVRFLRCRFTENISGFNGGAILNVRGDIMVDMSLFYRNKALQGGGIYNEDGSWLWVSSTVFLGNSSSCCGGGALAIDASRAIISSSAFSGNSVFGTNTLFSGGTIQTNGDVQLVNSAIVGSHSSSGNGSVFQQLQSDGNIESKIGIYNSIIWDNDRSNGVDFISQSDSGAVIDVYDSIVEIDMVSFFETAENVITTDPFFIDGNGGDNTHGTLDDNLKLSPISPAIDAGNIRFLPKDSIDQDSDGDFEESIPFDLEGNERIMGSSVDIGPFEHFIGSNTNDKNEELLEFLNIYPNPASTQVRMSYESDYLGEVEVWIDSVIGRSTLLYQGYKSSYYLEFDISTIGIPRGVYVIRLEKRGQISTTRLVVLQ